MSYIVRTGEARRAPGSCAKVSAGQTPTPA